MKELEATSGQRSLTDQYTRQCRACGRDLRMGRIETCGIRCAIVLDRARRKPPARTQITPAFLADVITGPPSSSPEAALSAVTMTFKPLAWKKP